MSQPIHAGGLLDLDRVELDPAREALFEQASKHCAGQAPWRQRKLAEYRTLLRLSLLSGRVQIVEADLELDFRVVVTLRAPVPCEPGADGRLRVAAGAVLGLRYGEEAVRIPQPGYAFVQVLAPRGVFHSNVAVGSQQICLSAKLQAGVRLVELILLTYGALTLQNVVLDVRDPAGLLNPAAACYFQDNPQYVPLTREPFIATAPV